MAARQQYLIFVFIDLLALNEIELDWIAEDHSGWGDGESGGREGGVERRVGCSRSFKGIDIFST